MTRMQCNSSVSSVSETLDWLFHARAAFVHEPRRVSNMKHSRGNETGIEYKRACFMREHRLT